MAIDDDKYKEQHDAQSGPRIGGFIQCYSRARFYMFDPRPAEVFIEDIAHHLSSINRYAGATVTPYSVSQHSVLVSRELESRWLASGKTWTDAGKIESLCGLLHDSPEAYTGADMPRPNKMYLRAVVVSVDDKTVLRNEKWSQVEDRIMEAVARRFGLPFPLPESIKPIDSAMLATEAPQLLSGGPVEGWWYVQEPLPIEIECWSAKRAEMEFLQRFEELGGKYA